MDGQAICDLWLFVTVCLVEDSIAGLRSLGRRWRVSLWYCTRWRYINIYNGIRKHRARGSPRVRERSEAGTHISSSLLRPWLTQAVWSKTLTVTHTHPQREACTQGKIRQGETEKSRGKDAQVAGLHWHYSVQRSSEEVVACQGNHSQWEARVGLAWMSNRCVLKVGAEVGEQGPALPGGRGEGTKTHPEIHDTFLWMDDQWAGHFQVHGPCWVLLYCWLLFFCEMDLPHHTHKWMYSFTAGVYLITTVISDTNNYSLF